MARRAGRGRLSGIEMLPAQATPIIAWANSELRDRERTQLDIYQEFCARLEELHREHRGELEFAIPSFSAFNRHSIKLAALARRLDETREISGALAEKFDAGASDDLTVIAAEAIKTLIFEVLTAAGESGIDPKGAMNLANALRAAAQAQGVSTVRRQKVEKEFAEKVDSAVEKVAKVKGMTAESAEAIKDLILGVRK
ncbi:MAG: DUF3486 family protein [Rhizobiaceae bacterium]|nr:DUF3486 family protein [Rhizobiaceae bacterium]